MSIDYPTPEQIPELKALWKTAFGDTDAFLADFFDIAYDPRRCRCAVAEGRVAAMLYWFGTEYAQQRLAYVYAVATDPAFRGRGLCRALMDDTAKLLTRLGFHGILLYPATEGLVQMYRKMGYARCTAVREFTCEAGEKIPMRAIGKTEYARLRRQYLPEGGAVQEGALLDFLASQADFFAGADWVAAVSEYDGVLHCQELLGNLTAAPGIVAALGKKSGFFRTFGTEKPFAMGMKLGDNCVLPRYFGLPLD